jgi:nitrogen regulatory protein P-II 1
LVSTSASMAKKATTSTRKESTHKETEKANIHMKKIEAIIQPFKLEDVKAALKKAGVDGLTITEVRGHGREKGHTEIYRGQEYEVQEIPRLKLELVVPAGRVEEVVAAIVDGARTGKIGDGKIFVSDVTEAIRIRNGDRGESAI